jgi:hypothetical protein
MSRIQGPKVQRMCSKAPVAEVVQIVLASRAVVHHPGRVVLRLSARRMLHTKATPKPELSVL